MIKVVLVHGWDEKNDFGWFIPLQERLKQLNIPCEAPNLPNPSNPVYSEWAKCLTDILNNDDIKSLILVGHSLGAFTILKLIDQSKDSNFLKKIKHLVLVGPVLGFLDLLPVYTVHSFNYQNFIQYQIKITIIYSVDDDYISVSHVDHFLEVFPCRNNVNYIKCENLMHFMGPDYPFITDYVENLCKTPE